MEKPPEPEFKAQLASRLRQTISSDYPVNGEKNHQTFLMHRVRFCTGNGLINVIHGTPISAIVEYERLFTLFHCIMKAQIYRLA